MKDNKIVVLSLFDGMSCGQIALNELGYECKYYSSELDKYCINQTQYNFPNTIQLGDVEKWGNWEIPWSEIDIIIAGSPCTGFSFAGKMLNFKDPQSKLFFVFVDILNHCKKYNKNVKYLLENVNMKKSFQAVINQTLNIFPVRINSNLLSAQNRDRLYWSNIKTKSVGLFNEIHTDIPQPKDLRILLKDILQDENIIDKKYYLKTTKVDFNGMDINKKSKTLRVGGGCSQSNKHNYDIIKVDKNINIKKNQNKSSCLTAGGNSGGNHSDMDIICVTNIGRRLDENGIRKDYDSYIPYTRVWRLNQNNKTNCLTSVQKDNLLTNGTFLRRLTPIECARLQTIPEWYKFKQNENKNTSDTQIYKMLGNGWTVEVIKHILKYYKHD